MRVQVHPADSGGCGQYRMRLPAQALASQGCDVTVAETLGGIFQDHYGEPELIGVNPPDADVVVLQRPLVRQLVDLIPHLQALGVAVVVEVDDDFHAIPLSNPARLQVDPDLQPDHNRDHLARACQLADLVTCTTPALARRYARHGRVQVIPNYIQGRWLDLELPDRDTGARLLGWTGVTLTHHGDLEVTGAVIPQLLEETAGWRFGAIGSARTLERLRLAPGDGHTVMPWADLLTDEYALSIARLSVGIVPLADTPFNRAKSWIKGLEYAAMGVPFVAADVAAYRDLRRNTHLGVLARSTGDWRRYLGQLMTNANYRDDQVGVSRRIAADWTIEKNVGRWWSAWSRALTNARTRPRKG